MFRHAFKSLNELTFQRKVSTQQIRMIASNSVPKDNDLETENAANRKWFSDLNEETIPKSLVKARFDRSSGNGGQNVNT